MGRWLLSPTQTSFAELCLDYSIHKSHTVNVPTTALSSWSPPASIPSSPILSPEGNSPFGSSVAFPFPPPADPSALSQLPTLADPKRCLLIPTVHCSPSPRRDKYMGNPGVKSHRLQRATGRSKSLGAGNTQLHMSVIPPTPGPRRYEVTWVSKLGQFDIIQDLEVEGYQIYAVQKWVVDRGRFMKVVVVYTGDSNDKITVTVISPYSGLPRSEATELLNKASSCLRWDGAKPRETTLGTIMITSLANFRSDLNIVKIPNGKYIDYRERLFVNINLLRVGCSGRTALNLDEPSEATKDKFLHLYYIPETVANTLGFDETVLRFIVLIQSALVIFGLFGMDEHRDGLLCDMTVDCLQRWTLEVGEKLRDLRLEPTDRTLDPAVAAGLLSVIISVRNKIVAILPQGVHVTRDPFLNPKYFTESLFQASPPNSVRVTPSQRHTNAFLSAIFVDQINRQFRRRQAESKQGYRLLNTSTFTSLLPNETFSPTGIGGPLLTETANLEEFVKSSAVVLGSKEAIESLQAVWTGRKGPGLIAAEGEADDERRDGLTTPAGVEDEDEDRLFNLMHPFTALKQKGQGISARIHGRKKASIDFSSGTDRQALLNPKGDLVRTSSGSHESYKTRRPAPHKSDELRSGTVSREDEPERHQRALSADEAVRPPRNYGFAQPHAPLSAQGSLMHLPPVSDESGAKLASRYTRRPKSLDLATRFNPMSQTDTFSTGVNETLPKETSLASVPDTLLSDEGEAVRKRPNARKTSSGKSKDNKPKVMSDNEGERMVDHMVHKTKTVMSHDYIRRRHSFSDAGEWQNVPLLTPRQMQVDLELMQRIEEVQWRKRQLYWALQIVRTLFSPVPKVAELLERKLTDQASDRKELDTLVDELWPSVATLPALSGLSLKSASRPPVPHTFNTICEDGTTVATAAHRATYYFFASDLNKLQEASSIIKRQRNDVYSTRVRAYMPLQPGDESATILQPERPWLVKCPFLWFCYVLYTFLVLTLQTIGVWSRPPPPVTITEAYVPRLRAEIDERGKTKEDRGNLASESKWFEEREWVLSSKNQRVSKVAEEEMRTL